MTAIDDLLKAAEVRALLDVSDRTLRRLEADPTAGFPTARYLRSRKLFLRSEIEEYLARLPTSRAQATPK